MPRRTKDREGRHVCAEEREKENEWAERTARKEIVFRFFFSLRSSEGEDADIKDNRQIKKNKDCWNHRSVSSSCLPPCASRSRWEGQANFTKSHNKSAA